jgi:hypothetical protein
MAYTFLHGIMSFSRFCSSLGLVAALPLLRITDLHRPYSPYPHRSITTRHQQDGYRSGRREYGHRGSHPRLLHCPSPQSKIGIRHRPRGRGHSGCPVAGADHYLLLQRATTLTLQVWRRHHRHAPHVGLRGTEYLLSFLDCSGSFFYRLHLLARSGSAHPECYKLADHILSNAPPVNDPTWDRMETIVFS